MISPKQLGVLGIGVLALAACTSDDAANVEVNPPSTAAATTAPTPTAGPTEADPTPDTFGSLADLVPEDLQGSVLALGIPPEEMRSTVYLEVEDGVATGVLPELLQAAGNLLGLETEQREFNNGDELEEAYLDGDPAAYMVVASPRGFPTSYADIVAFVEYDELFLLGPGVEIGDEPTDLCGLRIGQYEPEHSEPRLAGYFAEISALCEAMGESIELVSYTPDDISTSEAVAAGDIDAAPTDEVMGARALSDFPELSLGGHVTGRGTSTFIVGQEHGLAEPLAEALHELAANGTYEEIMASHGMPNVAPSEPMVNVVED
ncbi:hypothetical protein [Phytoactinopolyspora mesophila]|uniref:hypothetical protein n=1 Tax=Phytoactinopolyspora mesophila TaxID=2650750 RepID=UPI001390D17E|nr:hypothetical protein [Phytoactinopolyspora mesophila]